jgi:hypothetical protein
VQGIQRRVNDSIRMFRTFGDRTWQPGTVSFDKDYRIPNPGAVGSNPIGDANDFSNLMIHPSFFRTEITATPSPGNNPPAPRSAGRTDRCLRKRPAARQTRVLVERTFARLSGRRRLARDRECLNHGARARLLLAPSASCRGDQAESRDDPGQAPIMAAPQAEPVLLARPRL